MNAHPKHALMLAILVLALLLSACAPAATPAAPTTGSYAPAAPGFSGSGADGYSENKSNEWSSQDSNTSYQTAAGVADQRIVIRNADLTIVVDDPIRALQAITQMAESMGGFVVSSNLYKTQNSRGSEIPQAQLTVRVPAEKLNEALEQIKAQVKDREKDVRSEVVSGQDVTKEYTDLNSRLKNLQQTETQLREIMGSAVKTEDVLAVYRDLKQVREEIEVIQGQVQYYREAAALSSINLMIQAQAAVQPLEVASWQPVGVARDALQALIDTMQFLGSAAIWLIIFLLPVAGVIIMPIWLVWWFFRRGKKGGPTPPRAPAAPPQSTEAV